MLLVFSQAARDNLMYRAGDLRGEGGRFQVEDGGQGERGAVAAERAAAGEHFVEDRAEAEDVAAGVHFLAFGLLGRHIGGGAYDHAQVGEVGIGEGGVFGAWRGGFSLLGKAEIDHFDLAFGGHHDVAGLEVAVDDAGGVGGGECPGDLDGDRQRFFEAHAFPGNGLGEGLAGG